MIKKYILQTFNHNWITISGQDSRGENLTYFEIVPIAKKSIPVFQITSELVNEISDITGVIIGSNMSQSYMINIERFGFTIMDEEKLIAENLFYHNKEECHFREFLNIIFENTAQNIQIEGEKINQVGERVPKDFAKLPMANQELLIEKEEE